MAIATMGPEIGKSALIIVDMQNDFVHPEGGFAIRARERPEAGIDMPFLTGTIPQVKRLADHPEGRQSGRSPGSAADEILAGHQPQDRQGARSHCSAEHARPGR